MKITRKNEIETTDVRVGDQIQVGKYTATCQTIPAQGVALFYLDQYLDQGMRFTDFLADLLDFGERDKDGNIVVKSGLTGSAASRLNVEEIALFSVIDLVASTAAMCEWRTYQAGVYTQAEDWYRWNVEPNQNENAFFFRRLLFARLLRFNEALVIQRADGSVYLADSFGRDVYAFRPNRYTGITCNGLTLHGDRQEEEVFYFRLANQDAAGLLHRINGLYADAMAEALDKYKHSGGRSGVLKISGNATKNKNYEDDVARIMQTRFKAFFENKNAVIPLFDGYEYVPHDGPASQKINGEVGDMESLMRQAQDRACKGIQAFTGRGNHRLYDRRKFI